VADFAYKQTVLSLHCDGSDGATTITDNSFSPKTVTANNGAALSTSDKKFGTAALLLDGVNDYGNIPANSDFVFGTDPFTVEFWMKSSQANNAAGGFFPSMLDFSASASHGAFTFCNRIPNTDLLYVPFHNGSVFSSISSGLAVCDGAWHHIVLCRAGTTLYLFQDGVMTTGAIASGQLFGVSGQPVRLGWNSRDNRYYDGRLDDIRVTKGVCRYTAPFTPPVATWDDSFEAIDAAKPLRGLVPYATSALGTILAKRNAALPRARDIEHDGLGTISGTVAIDSTPDIPVRRLVRLVRDRDGLVVRETYSDATTGAYSFPEINQNVRYSAIAYDAYHDRRAVIADNLTPEIA